MRSPARRPTCIALTALLTASGCALSPDPLYDAFREPASETRPFVRWWWNGSRVNEGELVREIEVMKKAGIGGFEMNTIGMPDGVADEVLARHPEHPWLSPAWTRMVAVAAKAARDRGMTPDLIVGSGWPFGGRFLDPEEQTQRVRLVRRVLQGPSVLTTSAAELAIEPEEPGRRRRREHEPTPTASRLVFLRLLPAEASDGDFTAGHDLLARVGADGAISVDVPAGQHILYAGTWQAGFTHVKLGAPGADGPVVNHFDAKAVRKYLDHMSSVLAPALGGDMGNALRAMFVDSLELDHANWTGDLPEQFTKRRGYDLTPYLPFVLERDDPTSQSGFLQTVRRARYDYLKTLIELFDERFVHTYVAWAEAHRLKARIQAYGRETHPLHGSMAVHLPEGETWLWIDKVHKERIGVESTVVNKYVASAANLTGQRLRSFEAMTNAVPVFRATLQDFKRGMDQSLLSGVNHPVIHGFNYTPLDAGFPGWVRFGCYLNERNPWWPHFRRFSDYAARLSTLMRAGEMQARIAVLAPRPEEWARYGLLYQPFPEVHHPWYQYKLSEAIHQNGHGADYVSERILTEARFEAGQLVYGSRRYDALLLEDVGAMEPAAAQAVQRFAEAGGKVVFIGQRPARAPGLKDAAAEDAKVGRAVAATVAASPRNVVTVEAPAQENLLAWTSKTLAAIGLEADVALAPASAAVAQVHHRAGARDFYYLVNNDTEHAADVTARFNAARGRAWAWDPQTGARHPLGFAAGEDVSLHLEAMESLLVMFEPDDTGSPAATAPSRAAPLLPAGAVPRFAERPALTGAWQVTLEAAASGKVVKRQFDTLVDLSQQKDDPELFAFGGVARYNKTIDVGTTPPAALDLGTVHGAAELLVNGESVGVSWWGRHIHDVRGKLRPGQNQIEIRVATVLANLMKHKQDDRMAQRWASWAPPIPAGLVGPVRWLDVEPAAVTVAVKRR